MLFLEMCVPSNYLQWNNIFSVVIPVRGMLNRFAIVLFIYLLSLIFNSNNYLTNLSHAVNYAVNELSRKTNV